MCYPTSNQKWSVARMIYYSASFMETAPFMQGEIRVVRNPNEMTEGGVLVLWGGEDINPDIYGHPRHPFTGSPSNRDIVEVHLAQYAIDNGIPIVGICRGAQLLCALAGGSLIQDVRGHAGGNHVVVDVRTKQLTVVNSLHHQQMYLEEMPTDDYVLLAKSDDLSGFFGYGHTWKDNRPVVVEYEPEAVWFPKIKGLAIQWHPEYLPDYHPSQAYVQQLVDEFILKEVAYV
jgi:putative glutamine amidotransferase